MKYLALVLLLFSFNSFAARELTLTLGESVDIPITRHPADGTALLLMLPSEHGFQPGHERFAQRLAAQGIEVWMVDLYAAYFLPVSPSSLVRFSITDIASLITTVTDQTDKSIYMMSQDLGAVSLLHGLREWQQAKNKPDRLKGVVLISPNLYEGTPAAGSEIRYRPIARQTNFNLYIIQPSLSPKSWEMSTLMRTLEQGGSDVYMQPLRGVRDRFFFRPDATAAEDEAASHLVSWIRQALPLSDYFYRPRSAVKKIEIAEKPQRSKTQKGFRPYRGKFQSQDFELSDLSAKQQKLSDYRGKVVLLNFWASWCPPCIHEMPSMQALKDQFKDRPFEIVAVNMAEDRSTIINFLKQMDVDFEILMDTDGKVLQQWKVFAYPTSYVLDANGKIRYAGFGAIDWAENDIVKAIESLF